MTTISSWRFWVIILLGLATMACAGRRERREEARAERAERAEQKKAEREGRAAERPAAAPAAQSAAPAAALAPTSTAPTAAASADSTIMFIRVFAVSGGMVSNTVRSPIFDVTDEGEPKLVGILKGGTKLTHPVKPGQHTFMVMSNDGAADFMQATIVGGKTYYARVLQGGGWPALRYAFRPVRGREIGGKQFASWDERTQLVDEMPEWQNWAKNNSALVADKRARYWPEWSSKPEKARAAQTLNAEDGR